MTVELQKYGSIYSWFTLKFWRLRFATTNLLVNARVSKQVESLKKCLDVELIPKPRPRSTPAGTTREHESEELYQHTCDTYLRLQPVVQSAFAELDSYNAQFGLSLRVTTQDVALARQPAINSKLHPEDFLKP
eukprot:2502711-Heterocapsa_arctica.AAC.1